MTKAEASDAPSFFNRDSKAMAEGLALLSRSAVSIGDA